MIYLEQHKTVYVPRSTYRLGTKITFENQTTHKEYDFIVTEHSEYYYVLNLLSTDMEDGQYLYKITIGGELIESGIAQFGEFNEETNVQFTTDKTQYKTFQYD